MLILHRKPEQALIIGPDIRVVVLDSDGHGVRLGIEAPADVTILREEIRMEVEAENRKASRASAVELLVGLSRRDEGVVPDPE